MVSGFVFRVLRCVLVLVPFVIAATGSPTPALAADGLPCQPQAARQIGPARLLAQTCPIWVPSRIGSLPAYTFSRTGNAEVGRINKGRVGPSTHWFVCQRPGPVGGHDSLRNRWWALTRADNGRTGWVGQVYFQGGGKNEADAKLRLCDATAVEWARINGAGDPTGSPEVLPPEPRPTPAPATPAAPAAPKPRKKPRSRQRRPPKLTPLALPAPDPPAKSKYPCYDTDDGKSVTVQFGMRDESLYFDRTQVPALPLQKPRVTRSRAGTLIISTGSCRMTKDDVEPARWRIAGTMGVNYESEGVNNDIELRGSRFSRGLMIGVTQGSIPRDGGPARIIVKTSGCANLFWPTAIDTVSDLPFPFSRQVYNYTYWVAQKIGSAAVKRWTKLKCRTLAEHDVLLQADSDGDLQAWTEDRDVPPPKVFQTSQEKAPNLIVENRYEVDRPDVKVRD